MDPTSARRVVTVKHWGQWIVALLLVAVILTVLFLVLTSRKIEWSVTIDYLFHPTVLEGIRLTLVFTFLSMIISLIGGTVLAAMRESPNPILSRFSHLYIWFFRGTPLLVQLIFWFNIALFIPGITIGSFHLDTNSLVSGFTAALLALSLNESAYMAEIVRGGLLSVDKGQSEAAMALGYTPYQNFTRIVLPQALRVIIPPIGNQTITMLKATSLVSVVAAQDLLTMVQNIYSQNFRVIELLSVAALWYLFMTSIATIAQSWIERRLSRSGRVVARPDDRLTQADAIAAEEHA